MNKFFALVIFSCFSLTVFSQTSIVKVNSTKSGFTINVEGKDRVIKGMNWDYFPVGKNYDFVLWNQSEDFIKLALESEMLLLKKMGVNAIRVYTGMPKKWIEYIHNRFGIYTMLNHSFGRYGVTVNGNWVSNTDYANPEVREILLKEVKQLASDYKDTKGLLLFLLGNENNFGLFWEGAETENVPTEDKKSTLRAIAMYRLFNDASIAIKEIDSSHPVAICNGDLLFLEQIAKECPNVDILGINVYRGNSFGDLFERVKKEYGKPVLLTEFGSDAFDAVASKEDQESQAAILKDNWKEIYDNVAGLGKSENCLGGFTFQFSDGWWKTGQTINMDVHDVTASWSNGGYAFDYEKGKNNMNEEWFGICAKKASNDNEVYELKPRQAYYVLQKIHKLDPYGSSLPKLHKRIDKISSKTVKK